MDVEGWRLLRTGARDGAYNMALDQAVLEAVSAGRSPSTLRLYGWSPPAVSLGYFQRPDSDVNLAACREMGFDVVRRITGGRAVLHQDEVTYAVVASVDDPRFGSGILENYRVIAAVLQHFFRSFGIDVTLACGREGSRPAGADRSVCFAAPAHWELVCEGRKVAGCAQKRQGRAFLQHGSIPLRMDLECLYRALATDLSIAPEAGAALLAPKVGWLNQWLTSPVEQTLAKERLLRSFVECWGVDFVEDAPSKPEFMRARELMPAAVVMTAGKTDPPLL